MLVMQTSQNSKVILAFCPKCRDFIGASALQRNLQLVQKAHRCTTDKFLVEMPARKLVRRTCQS
jgi:hypothetical protein